MKRTSRLAALGSLVAGSLLLAACSGSADATTSSGEEVETVATIGIGVAPDFFFSHLYFAVENGFFAEQGLEATLTEFASGQEATEAVISGQVDLTGTTGPTVVNFAARDTGVKAIGNYSTGEGWFAVVGNEQTKDVKDIEDVAGLKIATQFNNAIDRVVRKFLDNHGKDTSFVDYLDVKSPQLVSGLARGDYAAAALWEPNISTALQNIEGSSILLDSDEAVKMRGYNIFGKEVAEDADVRNRILTALDETITWMNENPDEVLAMAMKNSGIKDEELAASIQAKLTYELDLGQEDLDDIAAVQDFLEGQGILEATQEQIDASVGVEEFEAWRAARG